MYPLSVNEVFEALKDKARSDESLRQQLLETRNAEYPLTSFCNISTALGYEISPMDIIDYGENAYAAMRRSTNGGGENAPKLAFEDDYYELFLTELESL